MAAFVLRVSTVETRPELRELAQSGGGWDHLLREAKRPEYPTAIASRVPQNHGYKSLLTNDMTSRMVIVSCKLFENWPMV